MDQIRHVRVLRDHAHRDHLFYAHRHVRVHHDHVLFPFYHDRDRHDHPLFLHDHHDRLLYDHDHALQKYFFL